MPGANTMTVDPIEPVSRPNRARFGILFLVIAVLFLLLVAYQIYVSKVAAQSAAMTVAKNLTLVLESKLTADFSAAERTVSAMVSEIEPDAMRPETANRYRSGITHRLKANVRNIPSASGLRYFDANGYRLYTNIDGEAPVNIADRPHFRQLKNDLANSTVFSEVTIGRLAGRVSIYVAKPVRDETGVFLGIASTAIDLTSIHEHFRSIEIGRDGVVTLRRLDNGASVVRFPGPVEVDNKPAPELPVRHALLKDDRGGTMDITSRIDGSRRIYGYRKIGAYPLFVAVGIADHDYLAEWRRNSGLLLAGSLLFLGTLGAVFSRLTAAESRRFKSEIKLRESENRFRHLTAISTDWYWEQDEDYRFTFISIDVDVRHGAAHEVVGKTRWEIPHVDTDPALMRTHDALLAARKPFKDLLIKRMGLDNTLHYARISGEPMFDQQGRFKGYRGVGRDVTERERAGEEIRRLALMVDTAPSAITVHGFDGRFIYANQRASELHGYSPEEFLALELRQLDVPGDARLIDARMQELRDRGEASFEVMHLRKDGTTLPMEVSVKLTTWAGKEALLSVASDITERKLAEAVRATLEAQLRESQKMEAIGTLAGGIARDFNNAVATILGNVELARADMSANPFALESLEEIRKAGSRARDLVQEILAFSRRQPTARKMTPLASVVDDSARLLRATLPARLTLEVQCDADVPAALADAIQIKQVLINLATNAMQAMRDGPGRIGIRLDTVMLDSALAAAHPALGAMHARRPGLTVRLAVSDDGPGMDAATLGRIFEPFFTTRQGDQATGLGLSVVHGIVQAHQGAIEVDSAPGKGTTFTLYLPTAEVRAGAAETAAAASPATTSAPGLAGGQRIAYIDDDESLVFLVQRLLERRGFRVSGYTNQREALAVIGAEPDRFDLVVSDYNMPGMSGLDVARAVRAIRADLPVAIASGFIDEALRAEAGAAGVRELIFKADAAEDVCEAFARLAQAVGAKSKSF